MVTLEAERNHRTVREELEGGACTLGIPEFNSHNGELCGFWRREASDRETQDVETASAGPATHQSTVSRTVAVEITAFICEELLALDHQPRGRLVDPESPS